MRDRFIGVWKLKSFVRRFRDGRVEYPYGEEPVGRISYDAAERMSAQLMRTGRHSSVPPGIGLIGGKASDAEIREAVTGFVSYFGTFDVDEATHTVVHHVQACLVPSWVGTNLKRTYRFEPGRLILTLQADRESDELAWEREAD